MITTQQIQQYREVGAVVVPGLLDGLVNVGRLASQSLSQKPRAIARPRLAFARG